VRVIVHSRTADQDRDIQTGLANRLHGSADSRVAAGGRDRDRYRYQAVGIVRGLSERCRRSVGSHVEHLEPDPAQQIREDR